MANLVVRLELSLDERFHGTIAVVGSDEIFVFDGWASFMAAIDHIRRFDPPGHVKHADPD